MDPNESGGLSSYYQHPPPPQPPSSTAISGGTGGATTITSLNNGTTAAAATSSPMVHSHSVVPPTAVSTSTTDACGGGGTVKRKRGRPRKYATPEKAAAAKRFSSATALASLSSATRISPPEKNEHDFNGGGSTGVIAGSSSCSKKFQLSSLGSTGQSFTPHVLTVAAGEDVFQKIMLFLQQSKREICILSASGTISNASLRQPATSGGSINYEGRFDILSLSGSFVSNETGTKSGGLSVCLASVDGQIIGGGVGGPLRAAGPVQVIVGSFVLDTKKDNAGAVKGDASAGKLPSPIGGASFSGVSFWSPNDSYQNVGASQQFTSLLPRNTESMEWKWRDGPGNDGQQSPENGNYEHIPE